MRAKSWVEQAAWAGLALAGGAAVAWLDRTASEVQGTLLLLMLLDFALMLPGRAKVTVVAIASVIPLNVAFVASAQGWNPAALFILVPALIAAAGGRLAGALLDVAAAQLTPRERRPDVPWYDRPLDQRVVLGVGLTVLAMLGTPMVVAMLAARRANAPLWVAIVWQIVTLLGWLGLAPILLRERDAMRSAKSAMSPSAADLGVHVAVVVVLAVVHAALIASIGRLLLAPRGGLSTWPGLLAGALVTYLPLDLLAYVTIIVLGFASDVSAHRRLATEREAALRAEATESRLAALRARLNPHFLFNALGGVRTLAASGDVERSNQMLAGITALLRYVLDDRHPTVALADELGFARDYLAVQQARFGDRLRFDIDADPGAERAAVPQLVLQPVVENAVEHGIQQRLEGGAIRIHARRLDDRVEIVVENDGPPPTGESPAHGIGLTSTRARLEGLYGSAGELRFEAHGEGQGRGARVVIRLPFQDVTSSQ